MLHYNYVGRRGSVVACMRDVQTRGGKFDPRLRGICSDVNCAPRQGTLLTRALSRLRSKWVPDRIVKVCLFE